MKTLQVFVFATVVACISGSPPALRGAKVIGGETADAGEFPHMISLRVNGRHNCGGSIISDTIILTAAHCVQGSSPSSLTIVSGTNNLNSGGNVNNVSEVIVHADFNAGDSWRNDVAIVKLSKAIVLSALEKPIALPSQDENPGDNSESIVSGWGYDSYPPTALPNELQKVKLQLITNERCNEQHSINVYPTHLCAGTVNGEGVCNGDSGSPLLSGGKQVGIVSWGRPCAIGFADVYTRVASYADWIAEMSA